MSEDDDWRMTEEMQTEVYRRVLEQVNEYFNRDLPYDHPNYVRLSLLSFNSQDPTKLYQFTGNGPKADSIAAIKTWLAKQDKKAQ